MTKTCSPEKLERAISDIDAELEEAHRDLERPWMDEDDTEEYILCLTRTRAWFQRLLDDLTGEDFRQGTR